MTGPDAASPAIPGSAAGGGHHTLRCGDASIAYCHTPGRTPGVMFLGGFKSDMTGTKAMALEAWARDTGVAFTRFDYQGHGASSGRFDEGTIGQWAEDALAVLDRVTQGPQILVGSSMGGWIMTLLAQERPDRVAGLLGIASAPDFTEDLILPAMDAAARRALATTGAWHRPSAYGPDPYPITRALLEDGRQRLVLRSTIVFDGPVRLLHGMADSDVPWRTSLRLTEALIAEDVRLILVKDGDHRLSRPQDLDLLRRTVAELVEQVSA